MPSPAPLLLILALTLVTAAAACAPSGGDGHVRAAQSQELDSAATDPSGDPAVTDPNAAARTQTATFGAGCYWCVEAVLEQLDGVVDVRSGFMGGHVEEPSYEAVCAGTTGHAEVVQVTFDPEVITYGDLLDWFWKLHDPTTLNRQGNDVGTQYRSAIFHHDDEQRRAAEASLAAAELSGDFGRPIVTEITEAGPFYEAKVSHQDYYRLNKRQAYCQIVIAPKLQKLGLDD